ncbi:virulence factor family protein [Labrys wisconsinensis]|uniref:Type IV secretory pathway VirJ component n=1 Tax=Labrys wisconsinensis TaxID=425677 RepID=A0ABU0JA09_9HYPH|nr:AcvB/VirJ family lysyl-phosphatidylglycerol hydrolase [Labrys wisconsinensis]MDQ0471102.1 type IV secretory pathway VirJ component [Labrys wisconsinensis]
MRLACLSLSILLAFAAPAFAAPREIQVDEESLGKVTVLAPAEEPQIWVALLSDKDGITAEYRAKAEKLVAAGAAVALIDTPKLIDGLAKGDEVDCHYAFGDIEDTARASQRALGMKVWRWPTLLGLGEMGGTLTYLAVAQAPENTAAGGVSLGFSTQFASKLVICDGAVGTKVHDGLWNYAPMVDLPARWTYVAADKPDAAVQAFLDASKKNTAALAVPGDDEARFDAALKAALEIGAPPQEELGDLPLEELPTDGPPIGLAVLLSGDGGWRDIDKSIAEILQQEGVAVVGVDSLRYFWSTKEPDVVASDIGRIIAHYTKIWGAKRVAVMGYSLGADVIPFAWQKFSPALKKQINLVALLGLEPTADFEISVSGWLGVASSSDIDLKPYLPSLPMEKTMCFYGEDEVADNETACVFPEMAKATIVKRPGGHHFDGNYEPVARMILERLKK